MPFTFWRGIPLDLAAAALVTVVMIIAASESADQPARQVDAAVVAILLFTGAWTAIARRAPRAALIGASVSFYAAVSVGIPDFSPALAIGVPVLIAAWKGHLWWALAVLALTGLISVPYRLSGPEAEPLGQVALSTLFDISLLGVLLLLGEALRSRRTIREEASLRLLLADQQHQRQLTEERLRAARELHDVLAHTVAVVGIQASVAAETIDSDPETAKQAVARVRTASQEATVDLRSTIAVLREDGTGAAQESALAEHQLAELIDAVRTSGLDVSLTVHGDLSTVRPSVELVIYRIVQESLTNVLRHSTAESVDVGLDLQADVVNVIIRDHGSPREPTPVRPDRHGSELQGMAERIAAAGGRLDYGPADDGEPGYRVRARLPTRGPQ
ncbi:sensor histidine kinase [Nesterenkonia sp. DZ6]|uniref:sensor histidine kinase n=1 Tax=Nesterenkonia sp. DZ6 TaxID=2901229 RepID=UPI001F4C62CE|nr:histidine kinase [Nesterenkonia sp. DZ6]